MVCLFSDSVVDRSISYGLPCLIDDGARDRVYLAPAYHGSEGVRGQLPFTFFFGVLVRSPIYLLVSRTPDELILT